jgi:aspartyl protease family protein
MKESIILALLLLSSSLQGQKIHTKEIKEPNGDGLIIFNIITDDIKIKFNKDLYYHWYNEFSGMQGSFGAAGGKLLHGRNSEFDENGRLKYQCYFKFGLSDSTELIFGESGLIISKNVYKNGIEIYSSGSWGNGDKYEIFSSEDKPDYRSKTYTPQNNLEFESKYYSFNPPIMEENQYYPDTKKLFKHSYFCNSRYYGEYKEYFESGALKCSGNYDKKYKHANKVGVWLIYNESTNKMDTIRYKLSERNLDSNGSKEIGSLVFSPAIKDWTASGNWYHIDINGSVIKVVLRESDIYENNVQVNKTYISTEDLSNTIKFIKSESGLIEVPVVLNGVLKINFIFDSGASEVSISPDVALTLIRAGTITESDFLQDQIYTFADGSKAQSKRFLIKKLVIGDQTLTNIEASISKSIEAPMLIGQNVMNKLGSVTIDYDNQLLIIRTK